MFLGRAACAALFHTFDLEADFLAKVFALFTLFSVDAFS